jgi:hypothetical protein
MQSTTVKVLLNGEDVKGMKKVLICRMTHFSFLRDQISTSFDELTLQRCDTTCDSLHRLQQCVEN